MSKKRTFYIVLAPNGKEGFITEDADDATYAQTGLYPHCAVSTVAESFRDAYGDADDDDFKLHMVELA